MDKKGKEKFHFVEEKNAKEIESKPEKEKETVQESRDEHIVSNKPYFSFQLRITILIVLIIVFFMIGLVLMVKALSYSETKKVEYIESADAEYKVCLKSSDPYLKNCVDSYKGSLDNVTALKVEYEYLAKIDKRAKIDLTYYIIVRGRIYDKFDSSRVLYENEELVVPKTSLHFRGGKVAVKELLNINLEKAIENVSQYQNSYVHNSTAVLEVVSYIDDGINRYKTGTLNVPLSEKRFKAYKNYPPSATHDVDAEMKEWNNEAIIYMIIGSSLMFISLITLFILTKLVNKSLIKKSKYEQRLDDILNVYSDIIVIPTDEYTYDKSKDKVKLKTFEDMLDTRKILDKPIIYNRINNVKSEFIIEDYDKVYIFVLKDIDIESK